MASGVSEFVERVKEAVSTTYLSLEDRYYSFVDWLVEKGIPADRAVEAIESKGIPSFPVFVLVLILLIGGIGWGAYSALAPHTYTVTIYGPDGTPLANTPVKINGEWYTTDELGRIHLEGVDGPVTVEIDGYKPYTLDPTIQNEILLNPVSKKVTIYVRDQTTGKNITTVKIKVYGADKTKEFSSAPATFYISQIASDSTVKVKDDGTVRVEAISALYGKASITVNWNDGEDTIQKTIYLKTTSQTGSESEKGKITVYIKPKNVVGRAYAYKNGVKISERLFQNGIVEFEDMPYGQYKIIFEPEINGTPISNPANTLYITHNRQNTTADITLSLPGYDGGDEYEPPEDIAKYYAVVYVKDEEGKPIVGARLRNAEDGTSIGKKSNSKGMIEVGFDAADAELNVYVTHDDYYPSEYFILSPQDEKEVTLKKLPEQGKIHLCVDEPWPDGGYVPVPLAYYKIVSDKWQKTGNVGEDGCSTIEGVPVGDVNITVMYPTGDFPVTTTAEVKNRKTTDVTVHLSRLVNVTVNVYRENDGARIVSTVSAVDSTGHKWASGMTTVAAGANLRVPAYVPIHFVIKYGRNYKYETEEKTFTTGETLDIYVPTAPKNEITFVGIEKDGKRVFMIGKDRRYDAVFRVVCANSCKYAVSATNIDTDVDKISVDCGSSMCVKTVSVPIRANEDQTYGYGTLEVNGMEIKIPYGFELTESSCEGRTCGKIYVEKDGNLINPNKLKTYTNYDFFVPFAVEANEDDVYGIDVDVGAIKAEPNGTTIAQIGKYTVGIITFSGYSEEDGKNEIYIDISDAYQIAVAVRFYNAMNLLDMNATVDENVPAGCGTYGVGYELRDAEGRPIVPVGGTSLIIQLTVYTSPDGSAWIKSDEKILDSPQGIIEIPTTNNGVKLVFEVPGYKSVEKYIYPKHVYITGKGYVIVQEPNQTGTGTVEYNVGMSGITLQLNGATKEDSYYRVEVGESDGLAAQVTAKRKYADDWTNWEYTYDITQDGGFTKNGYECSAVALTTVTIYEREENAPVDVTVNVSDECSCADDSNIIHSVTLTPSEGEITSAKIDDQDCTVEGGVAKCTVKTESAAATVSAEIYVDSVKIPSIDEITLDCGGSAPNCEVVPPEVSVKRVCSCEDDENVVNIVITPKEGKITSAALGGNACDVEDGVATCETTPSDDKVTISVKIIVGDKELEKTVAITPNECDDGSLCSGDSGGGSGGEEECTCSSQNRNVSRIDPAEASDGILYVAEGTFTIGETCDAMIAVEQGGNTVGAASGILPSDVFTGIYEYKVEIRGQYLEPGDMANLGTIYVKVKDIDVIGNEAYLLFGVPGSAVNCDGTPLKVTYKCGNTTQKFTVDVPQDVCEEAKQGGGTGGTGRQSPESSPAFARAEAIAVENGWFTFWSAYISPDCKNPTIVMTIWPLHKANSLSNDWAYNQDTGRDQAVAYTVSLPTPPEDGKAEWTGTWTGNGIRAEATGDNLGPSIPFWQVKLFVPYSDVCTALNDSTEVLGEEDAAAGYHIEVYCNGEKAWGEKGGVHWYNMPEGEEGCKKCENCKIDSIKYTYDKTENKIDVTIKAENAKNCEGVTLNILVNGKRAYATPIVWEEGKEEVELSVPADKLCVFADPEKDYQEVKAEVSCNNKEIKSVVYNLKLSCDMYYHLGQIYLPPVQVGESGGNKGYRIKNDVGKVEVSDTPDVQVCSKAWCEQHLVAKILEELAKNGGSTTINLLALPGNTDKIVDNDKITTDVVPVSVESEDESSETTKQRCEFYVTVSDLADCASACEQKLSDAGCTFLDYGYTKTGNTFQCQCIGYVETGGKSSTRTVDITVVNIGNGGDVCIYGDAIANLLTGKIERAVAVSFTAAAENLNENLQKALLDKGKQCINKNIIKIEKIQPGAVFINDNVTRYGYATLDGYFDFLEAMASSKPTKSGSGNAETFITGKVGDKIPAEIVITNDGEWAKAQAVPGCSEQGNVYKLGEGLITACPQGDDTKGIWHYESTVQLIANQEDETTPYMITEDLSMRIGRGFIAYTRTEILKNIGIPTTEPNYTAGESEDVANQLNDDAKEAASISESTTGDSGSSGGSEGGTETSTLTANVSAPGVVIVSESQPAGGGGGQSAHENVSMR